MARVTGGSSRTVSLGREPAPGGGYKRADAVSIAISMPHTEGYLWRLQVEAETLEGRFVVGTLLVGPPANLSSVDRKHATTARVVGVAFVPGAVAWHVNATNDNVPSSADISLQTAPCSGAERGITACGGARLDTPWDYRSSGASALTVISVPDGAQVEEISGVGGAVAGEIKVGALASNAIPLAAGQPFATFPKRLVGPVDVTFTNISRGFVSWGFGGPGN